MLYNLCRVCTALLNKQTNLIDVWFWVLFSVCDVNIWIQFGYGCVYALLHGICGCFGADWHLCHRLCTQLHCIVNFPLVTYVLLSNSSFVTTCFLLWRITSVVYLTLTCSCVSSGCTLENRSRAIGSSVLFHSLHSVQRDYTRSTTKTLQVLPLDPHYERPWVLCISWFVFLLRPNYPAASEATLTSWLEKKVFVYFGRISWFSVGSISFPVNYITSSMTCRQWRN